MDLQIKYFGISRLIDFVMFNWKDILIALGIFMIFVMFKGTFSKMIVKAFKKLKFLKSEDNEKGLDEALIKPLNRFMLFLGIYFAAKYLPFSPITDVIMTKLLKSLLVITLASGFYHMEFLYEGIFNRFDNKLNLGTSNMIKQVTVKLTRAIIIVLATAMVASEFFDVNGFIAGLGIAGLAFAMAAQDTLGSLFAGLSIILDKPFDVGDWISCNGIEGVVEELSFKSTRVRTFTKELVSVPNQILANNPISNFTRRGLRRVNFHLGVTYSTTAGQIAALNKEIEEYILSKDLVDKENVIVKFESFNNSSLDILINYFTTTTVLTEYLTVREEINMGIMDIMVKHGVSAAFPSTSIYFENKLER